jgi:hypothetical protein
MAGWGHHSTLAMFPEAPRVIPDGRISRVRVAIMALPRQLMWCPCPLLPTRPRPSPREDEVGALQVSVQRLQHGPGFRGCRHSLMFRPTGLLATQLAPTAVKSSTGQPWLLRPSSTRVVTFPCVGYACRPNRATDGRGLSPHQMRSLVGCSPNVRSRAACCQAPPLQRVVSVHNTLRCCSLWKKLALYIREQFLERPSRS